MNVFLAEDDVNISTIAKMALEQLGGHQVTHVDNGERALEAILTNGHNYDVILLDEMMPGLNGLAVCEKYVTQVADAKPVIFLSAKNQASDVKLFAEHGQGYIPKPFDPTQLCQQIEEILNKKPHRSAA